MVNDYRRGNQTTYFISEESDHELHAQSTDLARLNAHLAGFCDYHGKKEAITETYNGFVAMGVTKA